MINKRGINIRVKKPSFLESLGIGLDRESHFTISPNGEYIVGKNIGKSGDVEVVFYDSGSLGVLDKHIAETQRTLRGSDYSGVVRVSSDSEMIQSRYIPELFSIEDRNEEYANPEDFRAEVDKLTGRFSGKLFVRKAA